MSKYNFAQKDLVAFDYGGVTGYGSIAGVATTELPILGYYYIINVLTSNQNLPSEAYPFTTLTLPEIGIVKLTMDEKHSLIDDVSVRHVWLGTKHILSLKTEYLYAVAAMPEPERSDHVHDWAHSMFAITELPSKVSFNHLHQLLRHYTSRGY